MEKIDILMATYNSEKYIRQQIESILNQTYTNFRLIISDDCSKDSTREILKEYSQKDDRIVIFYQEKNLGYVGNFEFLLSKVQDNIYMFSDHDDVWLPTKVEKSYQKLQETNADLVFTDLEIVDKDLKTIYPSFNDYMKLSRKIKKFKSDYRLQYLYNCITGCTLMAKKKFFDKILPLPRDSKYVIHDYWIGLVYALYGKVEYLDEQTIKYRQHGDNQVGTDKISHKFTKMEGVRNLFIDVKIQLFKTYVNHEDIFPDKLKSMNKKALHYYMDIQDKKIINLKNWSVFHMLYKNETVIYYLENFIIMNLPIVGRLLFQIRHFILKILGKR